MKNSIALVRNFLSPLFLLITFLLATSCSIITSCTKDSNQDFIVPDNGYDWPLQERLYWPTDEWELASLEDHNIDPLKMDLADQFAENDSLARALLVIKDGYIVFEDYYGNGGKDQSTDLWSVTKSFSSALIGILMDQQTINSTDQLMSELMPSYPEFNEISLHHVLTQTTGLSWAESGQLWVDWIFSDDWVASALVRGQNNKPGKIFYYSSGNSHFLTSLVYYSTNKTPGKIAKERLFDPMGIEFDTLSHSIVYNSWDDYLTPLSQTWRRDTKGIETASFGLYMTARDMAKFGFLYLNRGKWDNQTLLSEDWVRTSTKDHITNIYGRYSYGYQWYITMVGGHPAFLASGYGGQIIGVVPSLDLVVVLKYEAENPVHPEAGTEHDDMHLFELVVESVNK
ncbi:MAG: serine hydrolase [Bacteroidetes bacterium]|nr:serine hydrolase [Bacteroidota bacterium]MBT6687494.1 serine hydrolase [Bacteroidota bacterium]MBT7142982.1 serine hydrolase [Bacteroidota bacterium]MBT7491672.1 serine hydrolase [Bacteroidota bacterium]